MMENEGKNPKIEKDTFLSFVKFNELVQKDESSRPNISKPQGQKMSIRPNISKN